jgi:pimeloyl-ACP methyl ester carboxylesterase
MTFAPVIPHPDLGHQRIWFWRGWRIRYTYLCPEPPAAQQATPLLLLHGFGASLEQWRQNLRTLSQERPVYALDLLGFGDSQKPAALLSTELWQTQVFDFWQAIIQRPVICLGHSLGALVALATTVAHPVMVERLVMITLPLARQELISGSLERLSRWMEGGMATPLLMRPLFYLVRQRWLIRTVLRRLYQQPDTVEEQLVSIFTRPTSDRGAARAFCYLVRSRTAADFSPLTRELIPQVSVPLLLLWGQQDNVLPIQWAQALTPLNPQLTFVALDQAGHCLYDEVPERLHQALTHWLG